MAYQLSGQLLISFSDSDDESDPDSKAASFCCPVRLTVPDVVCHTSHTETAKGGNENIP